MTHEDWYAHEENEEKIEGKSKTPRQQSNKTNKKWLKFNSFTCTYLPLLWNKNISPN